MRATYRYDWHVVCKSFCMKQLEIVELRCASFNYDFIHSALKDIVESPQKDSGCREILVFLHGTVETDIAIHMVHERKEALEGGSPTGFHLVNFLRPYGLVNHNIWTLVEE